MKFKARARFAGSVMSLATFGVSSAAFGMIADGDKYKRQMTSFIDEQDDGSGMPAQQTSPERDASGAALDDIKADLAAQRELLNNQAQLIAEQRQQIEMLMKRLDDNTALAETRGTGAAIIPFAIQNAATETAPQGTVGEAPPADRQITPRVAAIPEGQGVLTPRGRLIMEPSFEFTRSSANRLVFRGFELIPGIQIGVIEASDVDRDAMIGTMALRYGLTNRLEIEARMPALARRDRIQVAQLRNEGIVREIKLNGYDIGDAEIGLRYQLNLPKGPEQPIYVAGLKLKSNTGRGPFDIGFDSFGVATGLATGSGFWALQPSASFLLPSDPGVIYGGMSYLWHIPRNINKTISGAQVGRVDPGDAVAMNLGFGFALNPRFSFSLGYGHSYIFASKTEIGGTNQRSKSLQVGSFSLGTSYRISERQSVNLGFEFGMTSDAPDISISLRLPLRF
jgi:hypothetical protein